MERRFPSRKKPLRVNDSPIQLFWHPVFPDREFGVDFYMDEK